jgi:hypothetical protein
MVEGMEYMTMLALTVAGPVPVIGKGGCSCPVVLPKPTAPAVEFGDVAARKSMAEVSTLARAL